MGRRDEVVGRVRGVMEAAGLDVEEVGDGRLMSMLSGEHKRTIPVLLDVGERGVRLTSLFCGAPDEQHAEVYAVLLHRNERARHVHFCLDDTGDIVLTGWLPLAAADEQQVGDLLGELLATADELYDGVLRRGFADYLAHEQAWRAKAGMAPNPVGAPERPGS